MSFLVINGFITLSMLPAIAGLVFALVLLLFSVRTGLARFTLVGLIALLTGGVLSWLGIGNNLGLSIFFRFIGLTFALSGFCTLRSYLINTTLPEKQCDDK
jgi:hypothetical protein